MQGIIHIRKVKHKSFTNAGKIRLFKIFLLVSIYFNLFQGLSVLAQSDSLASYLEIAAKNNPTVLQRFYEYQASLQKVPQVGSMPDPELSIGVFLKPMELVMGRQTADIKLMQMFPWFGTLKSARDEMSLMANAKYESFRDAKLRVLYDVQNTWYEIYKINQELRISEKNLQILRTIERLALVRFRTSGVSSGSASSGSMGSGNTFQSQPAGSSTGMQGMPAAQVAVAPSGSGSPSSVPGNNMGSSSASTGLSDLYLIQIETGDLENNIALLNSIKRTTTAKFNGFLNRYPESAVAVTDTLRADTLNTSLTAISDSMMDKNPMLGMLRFEQQSLDAKKKMVTRMGYPMVGLGVNYSPVSKSEMSTSPMNGTDMIMPMVSVTLPVYRRKFRAMQTEADLMKSSLAENYNATANSLQTEYYLAVQLFQDAKRRISLYSNQYQLAKKSLDIMLKNYSSAGSTLTDILRIQQRTLDYELKRVEAVADYNTSIAWLRRLGNLGIDGNRWK